MTVRISLFGIMSSHLDGNLIRLPPRSQVPSLWAYLLLHAGQSLPRDRVAFTFWPEEAEAEARANLRRHLYRLRQLLPEPPEEQPWVLADGASLSWNLQSDYWLDVDEFQRLSTGGDGLDQAVRLYAGDLLEDIYDDWVVPERERLRGVYLDNLQRLIAWQTQRGSYAQAIRYAERLLRQDPLREQSYQELMKLHAFVGDRASLVRTYQACRAVLSQELDVEPSVATRSTFESLLAQAQTPAASSPAAGARPPVRPMPLELTDIVGRRNELQALTAAIASDRLVSLVGMPGIGKTRLALELASRRDPGQDPEVWWVDLASLADPELVAQAIATSLGIRTLVRQPPVETISEVIGERQGLLLLDNCEHLVDTVAALVTGLLARAPRLRVLVTSSEPLGVTGEVVIGLQPLSLPELETGPLGVHELRRLLQSSESGQLFITRAIEALPTFHLTSANTPAIVKICRALDGIPLAIELAAARLKVLSVEQIAERIEDRFHLLTGGSRTALPRHQTLRATLDWAHSLLEDNERAFFRRLSVFAGGFNFEAVEFVCPGGPIEPDDVLELLSSLIDRSLVTVIRPDRGPVRYAMLETVNQYARERLVDSDEAKIVRQRFVEYFTQLAERAGPQLLRGGTDQADWFDRLQLEQDNLRAALAWAVGSADYPAIARIGGAIWPFWWTRGSVPEGRQWLAPAMVSRQRLGDEDRSRLLFAEGRLALLQGDFEAGLAALEEHLALVEPTGDAGALAEALTSLGIAQHRLGSFDNAQAYWERALAHYEGVGDRWGVARALNNLGDLETFLEQYESARKHLAQSRSIFRQLESALGESIALINLGRAALLQGDADEAQLSFEDSLRLKQALSDREGIAWNLEGLAAVAAAQGNGSRAARLFGAAASLRDEIGVPVAPQDKGFYQANLEAAKNLLAPEAWQAAWEQGGQLTAEQALALSLGKDESE